MTETQGAVSRSAPLDNWLRPLVVEAIGPFALVFIGAGAIIATGGKDLVAIALAHGLAIGLMVAAAGPTGNPILPASSCATMAPRR